MSLIGLLVETSMKSSVLILAALAAVACLRRQSAALRHWILSGAIVAATLSPVLGLVMPAWHVPLDSISPPRLKAMAVAAPSPRVPASRPADIGPRREGAGMSRPGADVLVPTAWLAGTGVSLLIRLIDGQRVDALRMELSTKLVVRESTAPPRR